jgi:hypothetical protein
MILGLRDFPNLDDPETPVVVAKKVRSKQYEQSAESIFILPALELRFQTRQLEGKNLFLQQSMKINSIL